MQSLTLVIWGACRTSEGPGFEPLISKPSKCDSFEGKRTPEGIFRLDSKTTQSRESRARVFRWWWAAWAAADGWDSAIVAPRPPVTVSQLLLRARVRDPAVVGPSRQRQRNLPHSMR